MEVDYNISFPIYNADGTPFHNLVLHKAVYESVVMSLGDKITGDVYYKDNTLTCAMNEYVVYEGVKYTLVNPPTILREGMAADNGELHGMTKYSFEFYHPMVMLGNLPFTDVAVSSNELRYKSQDKKFSWAGYLRDFIAKLNKNLQGTEWICELSTSITEDKFKKFSDVLSFDNSTIADALKQAYDTWEVPFVIDETNDYDGKKYLIVFGLPSNEIYASRQDELENKPFIFQFGKGVGLKNNSRTPKNNKIVTRIAGYGAERNIPFGYPQIVWEGDQSWDYTIDNDASNPLSYPIYKGIVNGQWVKLIKHPFTRNHLMPTIYVESVAKKVNPLREDYDPNTIIIDYHDATNGDRFPHVINLLAPSYEIHQFEDIFPELGVANILDAYPIKSSDLSPDESWIDDLDENGEYTQSYFKVVLPLLDFDIYACAAITEEMEINMRSGACIGCTFTIQVDWEDYKANFYDSDGNFAPDGSQRNLDKYPKSNEDAITVVCQKDLNTFGTIMPNTYQSPKKSDQFVILGISLPLTYITNAQQRLDEAMDEYMLENNVYYYEYPLKFDAYFLATNPYILSQLRNNMIVRFWYVDKVIPLYIKQLSVSYGSSPLPEYNITLTDDVEIVLNQIGQVTEDVSRMRVQVSALQAYFDKSLVAELQTKLSKIHDDNAQGLITFNRGLTTLGNVASQPFVQGWTGAGWKVLLNGKAEFHDLVVRRTMKVFELLVQQVRSTGGEIVVSAANGRVANVDGTTLTIENATDSGDSFGNMFVVGDIIRCQRWDNAMNTTHFWEAIVQSATTDTITIRDLNGNTPQVGDNVVQMGNVSNVDRQGIISISASDGGEPKITIFDNVKSFDLSTNVRVVLGSLNDVNDMSFGQLHGYGLYSDNAYLKGEFHLNNGESIGTKLDIIEGQVNSVVKGMSEVGNIVINGQMTSFEGWTWSETNRFNGDHERYGSQVYLANQELSIETPSSGYTPKTHYDIEQGMPCIRTYGGTRLVGYTNPNENNVTWQNAMLSMVMFGQQFVEVRVMIGGVTIFNRGFTPTNVDSRGFWKIEATFDLSWATSYPRIEIYPYGEICIGDVRLYQPVSSEIKQTANEITLSVGNELQSTGIDITQHQITLKGDTLVQTGDYSGSLFTSRLIDGVEKSVFASDLVITEQVIATWPTGEKRITINYNASGALQYWYPIGEGETTQRLMRSEEISYDTNGSINGFKVVFYNRDGSVRWVQNANGTISGTGSTPPAPVINWVAHWYVDCGHHDEPIDEWDVQSALQPNLTLWSKNGGSGKMYYDTSLTEDSTATENDESGNEFDGWVCDPQMEWVATPELGDGTGYYQRWVAQYVDGVLTQEQYKHITTKD